MLTSTKRTLCLSIEKAKRDHSGKYGVVVENSIGIQKGICTVTVVGEFWIFGLISQMLFCFYCIVFNLF